MDVEVSNKMIVAWEMGYFLKPKNKAYVMPAKREVSLLDGASNSFVAKSLVFMQSTQDLKSIFHLHVRLNDLSLLTVFACHG